MEKRKRDYGITSFVPFGQQKELFEDMKEDALKPYADRARFRLYYGGNGA